MYKITQLESGQPVIFYLENEKVTMYSINSGRIRNHGIIFTDVESDFDICSELKLVYYISLSNQAVISSMENLNIREDYIIEGNPQSQATENTNFNIYSINSDYSIVNLSSKQYNSSNPDSKSKMTKQHNEELEKLQAYFNQILDDKDSEIENLKEIQTNITNQYNELSDYTGKLQDEVRKLRCNY